MGTHTRRSEQRKPLRRIRTRGLIPLQPVQGPPTDLAGRHGRLAVSSQVATRSRVVVETADAFGGSAAHDDVCEGPVGYEPGRGVVGGLVAGARGLEAEGCED